LNIGSTEIVTSPTFSLVHVYDSPIGSIHHFDLYRINKDDDLMNIGFYDVLHHSPMIVEWPRVLVQPCISIDIKQGTSPSTRCIKIESHA
jgi:tRNA threonylcarbamoyl adenosine modification protein YjeE